MSDRYQIHAAACELARLFDADIEEDSLVENPLDPGDRGLVVRETHGHRVISTMTWGFPLQPSKAALERHPKAKSKPVNKAKGLTRPFWKDVAENPVHRCLIPVQRFVEPPVKRQSEETWFALPDQPVFAWAGLWKTSEEWGNVYSAVMTEACAYVGPVHDRMPVILHPRDWQRWMHGTLDDVLALQQPYSGPMIVEKGAMGAVSPAPDAP
ncbi:MAG TPA: SOS response-associated peptidase family protein [Sphingobium sp.]